MKKYLYATAIAAFMISSCGDDENALPSDAGSVTDLEANTLTDNRDGNVYKIITIGDQVWMAEDLKYLPAVVGPFTMSDTIPYYYVYDYEGTDVAAAKSSDNYNTYGVLYNWTAASANSASASNPSGVRGVCPSGWHLPSSAEWDQLFNHLGGIFEAGGKLKQKGTTHWKAQNWKATNESGFTALPGGILWAEAFIYLGSRGNWWSATEEGPHQDIVVFRQDNDRSEVLRRSFGKQMGLCVRCVMD